MKCFFFLLFVIFSSVLFAQKQANFWYFGKYAGLDFSSGSPEAILNGKLNTDEGCATISDSEGNLLFYTDGVSVYNKNHTLMPNGTNLLGHPSSTHSAIIVPKPNNKDVYYIFTVDAYDISNNDGPLAYSEVDMTLDNGLGDITSNKNIILANPVNEKVAAVKKSKNEDVYWIVTHKRHSDEFLTFKLTENGLDATPLISNTGSNSEYYVTGQIKFSPINSKLAVARGNEIQLFDFDNETGKISNPLTIHYTRVSGAYNGAFYGLEFSPNGKFLYVAYYGGVSQYDLRSWSETDIVTSKIILATEQSGFNSLQTGLDGKIYVARYDRTFLDAIENPNVKGLDCNYTAQAVDLKGRHAYLGLPTFIQSFFRIDDVIYEYTCLGDSTKFELTNTVDTVTWNFGDPASGANNTVTGINPTHKFSAAGVYTVTATATLGGEVSTITTEIVIHQVPKATQPNNISICDTDNDGFYNFDLTTQTTQILNGQNSNDFQVDYYANLADYNANNPIANYNSYRNSNAYQSQIIIAAVTNKNNTTCKGTTSFTIQVFESPKPALSSEIPNLSDCDNTSVGTDIDGKIIFDLTEKEATILNGQSATNFQVDYFLDEALTQQITNPTTYSNSSASQTIYAKVTNKNNADCYASTSFNLEVFKLPVVNTPVELKQCDDDTDGRSFFNLTEVNAKIVTNPSDYTISYFKTETQALNNDTPISNFTTYENQTISFDTVFARVENANGCFRTSKVNLTVSTTQIPLTYTKEFYQCDDGIDTTDGVATFNFSQVTDEIRAIFPSNQQLIIKYYQTQQDALAEVNAITDISNYQNIASPNQQNIYIRVDSALDNDCLGLGHHITLFVEKQPIANTVTIAPQCDNDRDGLFDFDTSTIQNTLIGSQTRVAVTYTDENGNSLPSPLPNPFTTTTQTITARVTNTNSKDADGQCYTETSIKFIVNSVPVANIISPQEQCDDDTDGIVSFDTSAIEATILGNQTGMIVKYFDDNGTELPSPLPNPFETTSQTITVRIENPQYAICFEETTVEFIVREKPTVEIVDEAIICMTETPNQEIAVLNPNSNFTYNWFNEKGDRIGTGETISVQKGGVYSVTATSQYNCESEKAIINVIESEKATLNQEDIKIIEDSSNNSIAINTSNLGLGDYEFQLLDIDQRVIYNYQESPFFENLEGGIYTIEINDKNGCGTVKEEVSVISYPKFITPNNDGYNDAWTINGFNTYFYPTSAIYIYDRFGKLIAELPAENPIWDGNYNGIPAPSTDYWFYVKLTDRNGNIKSKKGNFSLLRK